MVARIILLAAVIASTALVFHALDAGGITYLADAAVPLGLAAAAQGLTYAALLAWICAKARIARLPLFLTLFAVIYGIDVFMSLNESLIFGEALSFTGSDMIEGLLAGLPLALVSAALAVWLFGPVAPSTLDSANSRGILAWTWRVGIVSLAYPVFYFLAGFFIAWQFADVRAFYEGKIHISPGTLFAVQIVRGAVWAGLGLLLIRALRASRGTVALAVGLSFAVFFSMQLLYPNPFMPLEIRLPHFAEVLTSNFLFGLLAGYVLAPPKSASG